MAGLPSKLKHELRRLLIDPAPGISAGLDESCCGKLNAIILGPPDTPYAGGIFKLKCEVPMDYPWKPPKFTFCTKIYHPNISASGDICLNILSEKWSPGYTIEGALLCIQLLLMDPILDDPLELDIAEVWKDDAEAAIETAKAWTRRYAMD